MRPRVGKYSSWNLLIDSLYIVKNGPGSNLSWNKLCQFIGNSVASEAKPQRVSNVLFITGIK